MRRLVSLVLVLSTIQFSQAQEKAITSKGDTVLLYEDGSWKYQVHTPKAALLSTAIVADPTIKVDSTRQITTDNVEILFAASPRLMRYFGENASKIRCKINCTNDHGEISIRFMWEFPVKDGDRYYGWFKEGTGVVLTMENDAKVVLLMSNKNAIKRFDNANYSMISNASIPLRTDQIDALVNQSIRKIEVDWKKKPEEYELDKSDKLKEVLSSVL